MALDLYKQALDIRRLIFDENHKLVADCLNNMGVMMRLKGDLNEAIEYV